eukprot:TRINITY_DN10338_c0_g1_i11.p1 TRINITY_DN10338_c0_g1~~TRINITY_DN10338_c0_g1_i11.p1  ORF type:complete len:122 (+),score=6.76 TRINITY_DN10338_c0_g1_i11:35-367(+)
MDRQHAISLVRLLTNHHTLRSNLLRMARKTQATTISEEKHQCRYCQQEDEDLVHLLVRCKAIEVSDARDKHLGDFHPSHFNDDKARGNWMANHNNWCYLLGFLDQLHLQT